MVVNDQEYVWSIYANRQLIITTFHIQILIILEPPQLKLLKSVYCDMMRCDVNMASKATLCYPVGVWVWFDGDNVFISDMCGSSGDKIYSHRDHRGIYPQTVFEPKIA
jgi:hypothetical protein